MRGRLREGERDGCSADVTVMSYSSSCAPDWVVTVTGC